MYARATRRWWVGATTGIGPLVLLHPRDFETEPGQSWLTAVIDLRGPQPGSPARQCFDLPPNADVRDSVTKSVGPGDRGLAPTPGQQSFVPRMQNISFPGYDQRQQSHVRPLNPP